ncbi:MAG: helix-turn-helix transcriptional regulator [Clostridia bacterium]|nr:helix-turn-helix transcriptional regulator [Clostridia bacterium]
MRNSLSKNIRDLRKHMGLTQELLAERLGVSLAAVSKWERGGSEPDLGYIMDLAGIFHVSVDALIGFSMPGSDADAEAERLEELAGSAPFEEVREQCEDALKKFPNHLRTVYAAAVAYDRRGTMHKDAACIRRALELYRHALTLLSRNRDPEINETLIRNEIAGCYSSLKDYKKAVEEWKKNHESGSNNAEIGLTLILYGKKPEEGLEYIRKAFVSGATELVTTMSGFTAYYLAAGDTKMSARAADWAVEHLSRLKKDPSKRAFTDKLVCMFILMKAAALDKDGQAEASETALRQAVDMAKAFDAEAVYTTENMLFIEGASDRAAFYDDMGPTAMQGLRAVLDEMGMASDAFRERFEQEAAGD